MNDTQPPATGPGSLDPSLNPVQPPNTSSQGYSFSPMIPAAQQGASPNPQASTPGTTQATIGTTPSTPSVMGTSGPGAPSVPQDNLGPGSQGQDVSQLQDYLVQMGYLTPDQVAGGQGTYGPQTTAAVAALQKGLGVQAGTNSGYYGPQTKSALASKYQNLFSTVQGTTAPDSGGLAAAQIQAATQPPTDPVLNAMTASLTPIMSSLNQVLNNINNPALSAVSLQTEYNNLQQQYNLPQMNASLMNMQNIMNGTPDDIRDEITKAGGTITDSQLQAMTASRNNVILKQYNALSTQYNAAQTNVQNMMQYAGQDQQNQLQVQNATAGIVENMASIESQMMSMGMTMQQNAVSNYKATLTTLGGNYSAFASTIPSNMQPAVESMMGFAPGTLSDPQELQVLTDASYKQMQMQIAAQRAAVYGYNAGYPIGEPAPGATGAAATPMTAVSPFSQTNPINNVQSSSSYTVQPGDGLKAIATKYGISSDTGIQAIAQLNGIKDINSIQAGQQLQIPIQVKDNSSGQTGYVSPDNFDPSKYTPLSGAPIAVPQSANDKAYQAMSAKVQAAMTTPITGSPLNKGRLTRNANSALKNYIASPVYQAVSSGATYLARIQGAMQDPGSVTDTSLADSIIKIETGGGQITDSQISTYFAGQSFSDKFAVAGDKITAKGGVLSPQQRADLSKLATDVFSNYQQQYENLYVQAMSNLEGQGIPLNYGGNLPDFLSLISTAPTQ